MAAAAAPAALQALATALCVLAAVALGWHAGRTAPAFWPCLPAIHIGGIGSGGGSGDGAGLLAAGGARRLLQVDDELMLPTSGHDVRTRLAVAPDGSFRWALVYQRPGESPHIGRGGWNRDLTVPAQAFVRVDGSSVYTAVDVMRLLAGKRVTVLGDSLTNQLHDIFVLSLQRQGYEDHVTQLPRRYSCNGSLDSTMQELEQDFVHVTPSVATAWASAEFKKRQCDTYINTFVIGGPFKNVTWTYYRAYMLIERDGTKQATYVLWPGLLDHIFANSDVVIANLGIHYRMDVWEDRLAYHYGILGDRMEALNKLPGKLAFFRQTLPQHFHTTDGSGQYKINTRFSSEPEFHTCHFADKVEIQLWRDRMLHEVAKPRGLAVQPTFWEMDKAEFHTTNLHGGYFRDCTHFAAVPEWWAPIWDTMYRTAAQELCKKREVDRRYCLGF